MMARASSSRPRRGLTVVAATTTTTNRRAPRDATACRDIGRPAQLLGLRNALGTTRPSSGLMERPRRTRGAGRGWRAGGQMTGVGGPTAATRAAKATPSGRALSEIRATPRRGPGSIHIRVASEKPAAGFIIFSGVRLSGHGSRSAAGRGAADAIHTRKGPLSTRGSSSPSWGATAPTSRTSLRRRVRRGLHADAARRPRRARLHPAPPLRRGGLPRRRSLCCGAATARCAGAAPTADRTLVDALASTEMRALAASSCRASTPEQRRPFCSCGHRLQPAARTTSSSRSRRRVPPTRAHVKARDQRGAVALTLGTGAAGPRPRQEPAVVVEARRTTGAPDSAGRRPCGAPGQRQPGTSSSSRRRAGTSSAQAPTPTLGRCSRSGAGQADAAAAARRRGAVSRHGPARHPEGA